MRGHRPTRHGGGDSARDPRPRGSAATFLVWSAPLCILVGGFLLIWLNSPWGVGAYHDSLNYFSAASNLAAGNGLSWTGSGGVLKPFTHYPPLYPMTLAALMATGLDAIAASRVVSAALLGLNAAVAAWVVWSATGSPVAAVFAPAVLLLPALLSQHLLAMSEPLFFLMTLVGLWLVTRGLQAGSLRALFLAGLLSSGAFLARYTGIAVLAAGAVAVLLLSGNHLRVVLKQLAAYLGGGLGLPAAWLVRNYAVTGSMTNREAGLHLVNLDAVRRWLDVIAAWFTDTYPSHWLESALIMAWFVLIGIAVFLGRRSPSVRRRKAAIQAGAFLVFWAVYTPSIFVSLSFFDASSRIDDRMLSPLLLAGALATLVLLGSLPSRRVPWALAVCVVGLGLLGPIPRAFAQSTAMLDQVRQVGLGFLGRSWRESEVVEWIRGSDPETVMVTNEAMAVQFLTGRAAVQVPEEYDPVKGQTRSDYATNLESMCRILEQGGAYLAVFGQAPPSAHCSFDLRVVLEAADGAVYAAERGAP